MIHLATSHNRQHRWIPIQRRYLERHTREPFRLHAVIEPESPFRSQFDLVEHPEVGRGGRVAWQRSLNSLSHRIARQADPEDLLVFLHGDAFPIADWVQALREMLSRAPLTAVRRDENMEPTPHECFCATTARFWAEIDGAWGPGPTWESDGRLVTDTSARLWGDLKRRGIRWQPILRSNAVDLHPLWFGIYGGIVYHHGGGFRAPVSRRDAAGYSHLPVPLRNAAGLRRRLANTLLSHRVYRRIVRDEEFFRMFQGEGAT